jgi:uncharacterized membrane protein YfcA
MFLDIFIIVVVTSFIQSIFGVGVLLFGTPLLLLQGYDFIQAVLVLLPISVSINLIQIARDYRSADWNFYKKILVYTIPFVVIFLLVVTRLNIKIGMIIGVFLLFVAAKDYSLKVNKVIKFLVRYEKVYLSIMGIVHGLTNLGGSLLTAIVHSKGYEKRITRVTVALSYATFATFQILTLLVSGYRIDITFSGIGVYLIPGITVFVLTEKLVYMEIKNENYSKYFAVFLFLSGVLLCVKSI